MSTPLQRKPYFQGSQRIVFDTFGGVFPWPGPELASELLLSVSGRYLGAPRRSQVPLAPHGRLWGFLVTPSFVHMGHLWPTMSPGSLPRASLGRLLSLFCITLVYSLSLSRALGHLLSSHRASCGFRLLTDATGVMGLAAGSAPLEYAPAPPAANRPEGGR